MLYQLMSASIKETDPFLTNAYLHMQVCKSVYFYLPCFKLAILNESGICACRYILWLKWNGCCITLVCFTLMCSCLFRLLLLWRHYLNIEDHYTLDLCWLLWSDESRHFQRWTCHCDRFVLPVLQPEARQRFDYVVCVSFKVCPERLNSHETIVHLLKSWQATSCL